jgi:acetyl esterase
MSGPRSRVLGGVSTLFGAARAHVSEVLGRSFFEGLSRAGKLHPQANPEVHNVEVTRDVHYSDSGQLDHRLDIYRRRDLPGPLPVVLYIHGGGFHLLSKETHWLMGLMFARAGYLVFNMSYRLAPTHRFPAATEDACDALVWVAEHAARYGGDLTRLVIAGESAGANLAAALAVVTCYERPEPYAQRVFRTGVVPRAVALGCGILQVSDPERLWRRRKLPWWLRGVISDIAYGYLGAQRAGCELADPLCLLEAGQAPTRPLPAFFSFVGTKDPLLDDTRRLGHALERLGVRHTERYYAGELHAFHALLFRRAARELWRDKLKFLDYVVRSERSLSRAS